MAKVIILCEKLLNLSREIFPNVDTSEAIDWDCEVQVNRIFEIVKDVTLQGCEINIEDSEDLECESDLSGFENIEDSMQQNSDTAMLSASEESSQEIPTSQDWEQEKVGNVNFSFDEMKNIVSFYDSVKKNKLVSTKKRYQKVRDRAMIARFKSYLNENGKKRDKLTMVEKHVKSKFDEAKCKLLHISERDMQRWGAQKARELGLPFKASKSWLKVIKKKYGYVSRKITKYVTRKEIENRSETEKVAFDFVREVMEQCEGYSADNIYNFDESGFKYEFTPKRTLSYKGEKDTLGLLSSHHANSHSYTIMPLLSMSGKLSGKLLVCLQEPKGSIGPRVAESLEIPENIYLIASKSGKMDKLLMKKWINECIAPVASKNKIVLIYDSWKGHLDPKLYEDLGNQCERFVIPAGATSLVQPLDRHFFIEYKLFRRKIFDRVNLDELEFDLHKRQNVLKMHSLIYNQLQAPVFNAMCQYAWFACKYSKQRVKFQSVNEKCFGLQYDKCEYDNCQEENFMKCAHCDLHLCLNHCLLQLHYHSETEAAGASQQLPQ